MSATVVAATLTAHRRTDRKTPDCDQLKRLVNKGMTQQQMADWTLEHLGERVTRSAIAKALDRCNLRVLNERGRHEAELPWRVRSEDMQHEYPKRLRLLGRENKGLPLKRDEQGMLRKFKAELDAKNASVWYDPEYLSIRWVLVARDPSRGEKYVRYPDNWDGPRIPVD